MLHNNRDDFLRVLENTSARTGFPLLLIEKDYYLRVELTPELADRPFIIFIARTKWCKVGILPNLFQCGFRIIEIMPDDKEIFMNILKRYGS